MSAAREGDGRGDGAPRASSLCVYGYAAAGRGSEGFPAARRVPLPEPGTRRAGGRLARLALDLARAAGGGDHVNPSTGVLFGTALGALTETDDFLAHLIAADEATPKARSFSASVHNALASYVALQLGARGECSTLVHDEIAFAHALLAAQAAARRDPSAEFVVGALDEVPPGALGQLADAAHARATHKRAASEGGAVFGCGPERKDKRILARVGPIALARFPLDESPPIAAHDRDAQESVRERDARVREWFEARREALGAELMIVAPGAWNAPILDVVGAWPTDSIVVVDEIPHGSSLATTVALAVSQFTGKHQPDPWTDPIRLERICIAGRTPAGDACVITLDRG